MMESTGIIRRFDDLGRIVIPRRIREQLDIKEGQCTEVFVDEEDRIILVKCDGPGKEWPDNSMSGERIIDKEG